MEKRTKIKGWHLTALAGVVVLGIAIVVVIFKEDIAHFRSLGYLGAFLISILAASTIIIYIPGVPVIFALGGIFPFPSNPLHPFLVGLSAGLGEATGSLTWYLAGRGGHEFFRQKYDQAYSRVDRWIKRKGSSTLFIASAVINPLFSVVGASAGALRFPAWKFFLLCLAGKTVKGTAIAFLGWWGLSFILRWLRISI